ncbi:MAG: hypothetical protein ACI4HI_10765 [Lachnospiraceae bacterium]
MDPTSVYLMILNEKLFQANIIEKETKDRIRQLILQEEAAPLDTTQLKTRPPALESTAY